MIISLIAAIDEKNGIGYNNKLLWHLPKDLKWMKEKTMNHVILMGRNCYEDIISYTKGKPLPGRTNVVLTTKEIEKIHPDFVICRTTNEFLNKYSNETRIFILGGGKVYNQFIHIADELYITHVHKTYKADTFFPTFNKDDYNVSYEKKETDNNIDLTFKIYIKK